jgi:hypothetical protein
MAGDLQAGRAGSPATTQFAYTPPGTIASNSPRERTMRIRIFGTLALLLAIALPAAAGDLVGRWTAEFDSPIGVQKYVYVFKNTGDALTGEATFERSIGNGSVQLKNVKLEGDKVSFDEPLQVQGNEITIVYKGTLAGDEIKFERTVGDFGTEQLTAKRAPEPAK